MSEISLGRSPAGTSASLWLAAIAVSVSCLMAAAPASADTAKPAPTCEAIKTKCVSHVAKRMKQEKSPEDGVERPHLTLAECDESYRKAEKTGVWPEHIPFNFAMKCMP